ncbi:hypothetical protein [Niallia sp. MER 6]|uniref:hypothetical protein n=1 Tax=Niallia sp. MER 6 TaxID=2939567 RepID=UPI00203A4024|nr:hypothetical protein [Niallia sp. MER 6]
MLNKIKLIILFVLLLLPLNILLETTVTAAPPVCGIKSTESTEIQLTPIIGSSISNDDSNVSIMCSSGSYTWSSIKSSARLTNKQSASVNNYVKSGGKSKALSDFARMPGTSRSGGGEVLIKTFEGKTLTYYPKSTSTEKPTLRYPASNGKSWDKIRYE